MTNSSDGPARRRRHSSTPRRRIVVRFSDEEYTAITGHARSSGTAVAAWIAHRVLTGSAPVSSELVPELLAVRAEEEPVGDEEITHGGVGVGRSDVGAVGSTPMVTIWQRTGGRAFALAVLVAGLLIGMVGMHHLAIDTDHGAAPSASVELMPTAESVEGHGAPASDEGGHDHGLLHLCLAVLAAAAVIIVAQLMIRLSISAVVVPVLRRLSRIAAAPRGPPPSAPERLALLCVLRT